MGSPRASPPQQPRLVFPLSSSRVSSLASVSCSIIRSFRHGQIPHLDALSPLLAAFVQSSSCPTTTPIPHSPEFPLGASPVSRCGTGVGVSFVSLLCPYHQLSYFRSLITPCSTAIVRPFILHPSCLHI